MSYIKGSQENLVRRQMIGRVKKRQIFYKRTVRSALIGAATVMSLSFQAQAGEKVYDFQITSADAEKALKSLALYAKIPLLYPYDQIKSIKASAVDGSYTIEQALEILLQGTGFQGSLTKRGVIIITRTDNQTRFQEEQMQVRPIKKKLVETASVIILGAATNTAANAQTVQPAETQAPISTNAPAQSASNNTLFDEVVVTGSRIRRATNETAAIPVQVLTATDLEASGTVDVGELLTEIPGVDFSISPDTSQTSVQNNGLSTISLRRMGGARTLTLIDGRRAVSNSGNGERVNLSSIPAGFIKRVEVTTGGASAIYGSDAIAGVANIMLRDDYEGLELEYRHSEADASGEVENTFNLTYGTSFLNDRGYALFGLTYHDETAVFSDETRPDSFATVEWGAPTIRNEGDFDDERGFGNCDDSGRFCINPGGRSSFLPGGRFEAGDAWNIDGVWYNDRGATFPDGRPASEDFVTDVDGYNFRIGRMLSPEQNRLTLGSKIELELNENVTGFVDVFYNESETTSQSPPGTASNTTDIGALNALGDIGSMSSSHPFIPPEVEATRRGSVSWRRRFMEVGPEVRINNRDTLRTSFGLRGDVWDTWQWQAHGSFGKFNQHQQQLNELNYLNIRNALDIQSDGSGGFECEDADARAAGCVPLNIFGTGSISSEAADYIRYNGVLEQERTQQVWAASMNGELFEGPAGPIKAAFGIENRTEKQKTFGDPDNVAELTSLSHVPDIQAELDVTEFFAELDIPIIEDKLSLQLAARTADYSHIGNVISYNIGGSWQPFDSLRIRGQYSRSQRAPTITETFSPLRADNDTVRDACDNLLPDGSGVSSPVGSDTDLSAIVSTNCLAEPGIQGFFNDPNNAGDPFNGASSTFAPNGGNVNLQEETADTYTFGVIFTPGFIENLILIADYYSISLDDAIGSVSSQDVIDLCYTAASTDNRFCDVITRDATSGRIIEIQNILENLDNITREGIDFTLKYDWEIPQVPGEFGVSFIGTHYLKDETTFESINGLQVNDELGIIEKPKDEFRARLRWRKDGLRLVYTAKYRSGGVDDNTVEPADNEYFRVGSQTYHDLYASYSFRKDPRVKLYGGVRNLLNDNGPLVPSGLDHGSLRNIISEINNPIGREFFGGVRVRW